MARSCAADPLEKFRFIVSWSSDGESEPTPAVRVGFHDIQMPKRTTTKIQYREGADPDINQIAAGLSVMEDVMLSRGLIAEDENNEFYKWASAVHKPTAGHIGRAALKARPTDSASNLYKKDVTIKMLNREGSAVRQWTLFNSFPVSFIAGSDLDASEDGDKSLEQLTLGYEDFKEEVPDSTTEAAVSSALE